ncbi:MAG: hypothetical protein FJX71_00875 [Alphaproteobacteria bacterium]|nr:hypothetical protein [Alphaproteobacteria bacterium]
MKLAYSLILMFFFQIQNCLAMGDERVKDAHELSHQAALNFPFQLGFLISETSEMGSCIFLNETTAVTSTHLAMLHNKSEKQFIAAIDEAVLPVKAGAIDWLGVITKMPKDKVSMYDVHFLGTMEEIPVKDLKQEGESVSSLSESAERESKATAEDFLVLKEMMVNNKKYKLVGSDLAFLKLRKPIKLTKSPVKLQAFDPQIVAKLPAFALGFISLKRFSNGNYSLWGDNSQGLVVKSSMISCPSLSFFEETGSFYATYLSPGASDEKFSCAHLPLPQTEDQKIFGRIVGGMSGGPLFFKASDGTFIFGGSISQSYGSQLVPILEASQTSSDKKISKEATKLLKSYKNKDMVSYDVYQGLSKDDIEKIEKLMNPK